MTLGSLFSGAGLGDLGWMMAGFDIKWQVEVDPYCRKILDLRFPETTKYGDVKTFNGTKAEPVDIVAGGFPCQPFSIAGKQRGDKDDRNLWPEMLRVVKEIRPAWVVGENVSGIVPIYLDTILADLESVGYATRTFVFPAHALGANHRRERIWVVGYASEFRRIRHRKFEERQQCHEWRETFGVSRTDGENMANPKSNGREYSVDGASEKDSRERINKQSIARTSICSINWCRKYQEWGTTQSGICGVTHVRTNRVDRLKALGNGQVVAATCFIGTIIMEFERMNNASGFSI